MSRPPNSRPGRLSTSTLKLVERLQRALQRNDRPAIVGAISEVVDRRVEFGPQWRQIAQIAADHGEISLAREAIDLFVEAAGGGAQARFQKFDLLAQVGALSEAKALLDSLPADVPSPEINAFSHGTAALYLGNTEEARHRLESVTAARPALGQAWLPLAMLVDMAQNADLRRRIFAAETEMENVEPDQQAMYFYAQGKTHADLGDHESAFAAFARAARLKKTRVRYDRQGVAANAAEAMRGYTAGGIAEIANRQTEPTGRAIFVAGLPRSGTTLVEQILASHSEVSDGAEISLMRLFWQDLGGLDFETVRSHVEQHGAQWAARLWQHLLQERFPAPGRVVDKSTDGGFFFGIASTLLPDAPLIWVKRDPLDCAWSCFRTHFFSGLEWSYDFDDIAFHFRLADQLLAHWERVLGDRLLVLPYEELVDEPEPWIRRILDHCGLAIEQQCFAPHESRRAVLTSSAMQVRQPINRKGIGAAEPYREWMEPFTSAYFD